MARRSKRKNSRGKSGLPMILLGAAAVIGVVVVGALALKPSQKESTAADTMSFSIEDYRRDASRLTGNIYRIEGRVEQIETLGNDRVVAISVPGNKMERLPLLVRSGVAGRTNLTRGDSFVFEVECCTGHSAEKKEVKGVLVVRKVETEK
ncbi:MAG: hypothetical protein IKY91_01335 [Akkermansia sp.]|nr:hypothetical protein [Akkermansia sp.]